MMGAIFLEIIGPEKPGRSNAQGQRVSEPVVIDTCCQRHVYKHSDKAVTYFNQALFGNELAKGIGRLQRNLVSCGFFFNRGGSTVTTKQLAKSRLTHISREAATPGDFAGVRLGVPSVASRLRKARCGGYLDSMDAHCLGSGYSMRLLKKKPWYLTAVRA